MRMLLLLAPGARGCGHLSLSLLLLFLALPPFGHSTHDRAPRVAPNTHPLLAKRQSCPANYDSCAGLGYGGLCCASDTNCAFDAIGNVACCPFNAVCTGTIGAASALTVSRPSSGVVVVGPPPPTTTTPPPSAAAPTGYDIATPPDEIAGGYSTVPNQY